VSEKLHQKNINMHGHEQYGGIGINLEGICICPICGFKFHEEPGKPCYYKNCPKCGMMMTKDK